MKRTILPKNPPLFPRPFVQFDYDLSSPVDMLRYVARQRFAWPGGYELAEMYHDTSKGWKGTGWNVAGLTHDGECEDLTCDNCGKPFGYQTNEQEV